ncbi:MAG: putative dithiol-disulfide isomerase involved in polyketide biosynthesis [Solirubrobacterales bacterium]|nr:putative dithiol-disulfide isomerase involved in polyketide biosynthesis [Solirubrobacterales bacterium]
MRSVPTGAVTRLLSRLVVHVAYFTDPLCPWSWGAEPQVRRALVEFSDQVSFTYVMSGMAREIDPGPKLASTLDVVAETGMPADPRVWLEHPPRSSYPSCLAVKAAAEQQLEAPYLRRLREGAMLRRERLDNREALLVAARDVAGLDLARFEIDLGSNAIVELFGADRERSLAACGADRPDLPAFAVEGGAPIGIGELREALIAAGAAPGPLPSVEAALARFGALGAAEVAAICDLPGPRARIELWRLASEFRARPRESGFGELWERA